jgi:hypothetical protein
MMMRRRKKLKERAAEGVIVQRCHPRGTKDQEICSEGTKRNKRKVRG